MLLNDSLTGSSVLNKENITDDYRLACESRQVSLLEEKTQWAAGPNSGFLGMEKK